MQQIQVISPPEGFVFELIHPCRGVPFRVGYFSQLVWGCGGVWAVNLRGNRVHSAVAPAQWREIDWEYHQVSFSK